MNDQHLLKVCTACKQSFPATCANFYARQRRGKAELTPTCRECTKAKCRAHTAEVREARSVLNKVKRQSNLLEVRKKESSARAGRTSNQVESAKLTRKAWAEKNKALIIVKRCHFYQKNKVSVKEKNEIYRLRTMPQQRVTRSNYKARRKGAAGKYTVNDVRLQMVVQDAKCFWCLCDVSEAHHVDHLTPLNKGGDNNPDNIVISCVSCNTSRKDKMPAEYMEYRRLVAV